MSTDSSQAVTYRYRTDELEIGTHQFRVGLPQDTGSPLRAVGNSETSNVRRYTKPVTAEIAMDEAYRLSTYPNPVQQRASVELAVKERQDVSVRLYDLLGGGHATRRPTAGAGIAAPPVGCLVNRPHERDVLPAGEGRGVCRHQADHRRAVVAT